MMVTTLKFDPGHEESFERITRLVKRVLGVDIAAVSLIDGQHQRFRSIQGLKLTEIALESSFCRAPWREGTTIVIPDAACDAEFRNHPLVTEYPHLRAYAGVPLRTSAGEMIGTICAIHGAARQFSDSEIIVLEELAEIAAAELELREHASVDSLTGAMTRRAFLKESSRLCEFTRRKRLDMMVIMLDVDHFKQINDQYGHASGDDVLRSIAVACGANLRECDLFGRLGGEEFAVALEGNVEKAFAVAERLRSAIASLQFTFNEQEVRVTTSFGVAMVLEQDDVAAALIRADAALYSAKTQGRNRSVIAGV